MRSKIPVRILIVLLAAFLIFRIHQRVETYRVPREFCRSQMSVLAKANIQHMFETEGNPAPDLDSLLTYAKEKGYFETSISEDSIAVSFRSGHTRQVLIPNEWKNLWSTSAVHGIEAELEVLQDEHSDIEQEISECENLHGMSLDSLVVVREEYIAQHPVFEVENDDEDILSAGEFFDDSLGFSAQLLIDTEVNLVTSMDSLNSVIQNFNNIIAPVRKDSVSSIVVAVCPSIWQAGYYDSVYAYDPKLALGSQFSISCPNHDRHGGIVGGFVEKDYPDSIFMEPDWSETQIVYSFPEYGNMRRLQVSRANLIRTVEEEAAYLAQRYPLVITPKNFPSRAGGATPGANDHVSVIKYWDRSELGTLQIDEREVDLLDEPTWDFVKSKFRENNTTEMD
jgi:hypothetical protein